MVGSQIPGLAPSETQSAAGTPGYEESDETLGSSVSASTSASGTWVTLATFTGYELGPFDGIRIGFEAGADNEMRVTTGNGTEVWSGFPGSGSNVLIEATFSDEDFTSITVEAYDDYSATYTIHTAWSHAIGGHSHKL